MEAIAALTVFAMVLTVLFRIGANTWDRERIQAFIQQGGGRCIDVRWAPFGPGWFGEACRIYRIRYIDEHGNERHAHCKTRMRFGVYLLPDKYEVRAVAPTDAADAADAAAKLVAENERLRAEVERLRKQRG